MEMMPRLNSVMKQFPFSTARPGVQYISVQPVSWSEPSVLEQRFRPGLDPEQATAIAGEFVHNDYAYVFETNWDIWTRDELEDRLSLAPQPVKFIAHGTEFDEGAFQQAGHVQVDFGLDTPYLYEEFELDEGDERRMRANVQKLIDFTHAVERNCGLAGRVLWSESDENLAQKLIARMQKVN